MAKTALITGGGGAIALALSEKLEACGYDLILADLDRERMAGAAARLTRVAAQIPVDLSNAAGVAALCREIHDRRPVIDLLVNNAGLIVPGPITEISDEDMVRHIQVNLIAPMCLTRAAARVRRRAGRARSCRSSRPRR